MLGNIKTIFILKLKLIISQKSSFIVLGIMLLSSYLMVNTIESDIDEKSSLPIGVVDLDNSRLSNELVNNLESNEAVFLYQGSIAEMDELLKDNLIYTYFVIEENYERRIMAGNTTDLCTMYYLKNNKAYSLISDIVAGESMYTICLYKGLNTYMALPEPVQEEEGLRKYSVKEYIAYSQELTTDSMFDFTFDIQMVSLDSKLNLPQDDITNTVIYQQAILAILGVIQSFFILYLTGTIKNQESHMVRSRVHLSSISRHSCWIGELLTLVLSASVLNIIFFTMLNKTLFQTTLGNKIALFFLMELFLIGFTGFFLYLNQLIQKNSLYQIIGTFIIILFGGLSFLSLIGTVLPKEILNIAKFSPNYWFLTGFTDIIVYGISGSLKCFYYLIILSGVFVLLYSCRYNKNIKEKYIA